VQVDEVLERLEGVRRSGKGWSARCPCRNDDRNPSLTVGVGEEGQVLLHCQRGNACDVDEICTAMGLHVRDLWPEAQGVESKLILQETYPYTDEHGELLFQKLRFFDESTGRKTFRQRRQVNGNWVYDLGDTPKVLYNLPMVIRAVAEGTEVWVVEGEKDADALIAKGVVATTMPGGAGKWLPIHTEALANATVSVIADNDDPGYAHADTVRRELDKAGARVRVFYPPEGFKDISDALARGKGFDSLRLISGGAPRDTFSELVTALSDLATKDKLSIQTKLTKARSLLDGASLLVPPQELEVIDWLDFVNEEDEDYDWLCPGLLERMDRVIWVAAEGAGKTMLGRQVAICLAYGVHPFTGRKIPRIKTLTVDLENPDKIIRRKSRNIHHVAQRLSGGVKDPCANLVIKPDGLNLMKTADRVALERVMETHTPDILFIGPLYKSFIDPGGRTSESVATEMVMFLDHLRFTYGCALWMEQHAPLGSSTGREMRPFGSAVWSRWPEFGKALVADVTSGVPNTYKVENFRGDRDERQWPTVVKWGQSLPFEVVDF
jgi:AAA domain